MSTSMPPQEILNKQKELLDDLNADEKAISQLQEKIESIKSGMLKKEGKVQSINTTLAEVYHWSPDSNSSSLLDQKKQTVLAGKLSMEGYTDIILPVIKQKPLSLTAIVELINRESGINISPTAVAKMVSRINANEHIPIKRFKPGFYKYQP